MPKGTFPNSCCQLPHSCGEPLPTASTGDPPTLEGSFGSVSCGVTAPFLWALVIAGFVCTSKTGVSVSLSPVEVLWSNPTGLQDQIPWTNGFPVLCWILRLGSLTWGSEPSQQWENFFGIIVLQFVGHPAGGYGIWFYRDCAPPTISLQLPLCLWTRGILFWWVVVSSCWWWSNS